MDVDGTLTDGKIYIGDSGEIFTNGGFEKSEPPFLCVYTNQ